MKAHELKDSANYTVVLNLTNKYVYQKLEGKWRNNVGWHTELGTHEYELLWTPPREWKRGDIADISEFPHGCYLLELSKTPRIWEKIDDYSYRISGMYWPEMEVRKMLRGSVEFICR